VLWSAPAPQHIRVAFSEPIDPTTFTTDEVVLYDLHGHPIPVKGIVPVPFSGNSQFDIQIAAFPRDGYKLTVGARIADQFGNWMDQDQNGTKGTMSDLYTVTVVPNKVPVLTSVAGIRDGIVKVTFSQPIDPKTFTPAAVSIINLANHQAVTVTSVQMEPNSEGRSFDIFFNALFGNFQLTLSNTITDLFGQHSQNSGPQSFTIVPPSGPPGRPLTA
jgi:hypothetical protein